MKQNIKKGLLLFFIFTISAYILILFFYVKSFPTNVRLNFEFTNIIALFFLFVSYNLFNILRVYFLGKIFNKNFNFSDSYIFTLGGVLLALITPFQSGGMPFQLFLLSKKEINLGKATSIILMRGFQSIVVFVVTIPFVIVYIQNILSTSYVKNLLKYFIFLYSLITFLIFIIITLNEKVKIFIRKKMRDGYLKKIFISTFEVISNFFEGIKVIFSEGVKECFLSLFSTFISLYSYFALSFFVIKLVNENTNFFKAFSLQFLLTYLSAFVPTPGSSGVAEGGMALFFSQIVGKNNILIYIFIFRLLSTYLPAFFGLFSFLKMNMYEKSQ